ncbi:LysE family transporter [Archangium sp.]|uniref:LysE family transporter n=1 Tax=Archangium sp. TaxID=1872627 RepID=UPI003899EE8D
MDILLTALVAFVFGFIGSMPLAGPIALLVFSTSVRKHHGEALRIGLGAALAVALYAAVAFWGFSTFLAKHPVILPVSHALSALVLTVLGVHFARWRPRESEQPGRERHGRGLLLGFTLTALNPTLLATWTTAVAFLYSRQLVAFSGLLALPFSAAAGAGVACWQMVFVGLLRRYESRFPRHVLTWVVRSMGLVLLAGGVLAGIDFVREGLGGVRGG